MEGQIRGQVIDAAGAGVPEVTVVIVQSPDAAPDIAAVSNADGRFVFDGLPPGPTA